MRNIQTLWIDRSDRPQVQISDTGEYVPNAQIRLDGDNVYSVTIAGESPESLRALARAFDEAAVRLSATLDARAAREVNTAAGAA